jgi:DNA-binding CsgD family transcriptional regulator/DNA polymerase III delta prime subunit
MPEQIIGREHESSLVQAFLGDIGEGPAALLLSGEPGIGKTLLWEAGIARAAQSGFHRVVACRGVEAEASLAFAGLSELLARALDEAASSLAPPRRRALEVALLLAEPGQAAPDALAIGLAVLDVLRILARDGPILVAIDDMQWLDTTSAGALQVAFRRMHDEPVRVLATVRRGADVAPMQLEQAFPHERLSRVSVGPLDPAATHDLLADRLGLHLTRPQLARVHEATAGNPFFAIELGRELVRTETRPVPGQALPMPKSLRELLGGRLAQLPAETMDVLLQVSALGRPTLELVALAHGDGDRVGAAVEAAAQEGVIEVDGTRLRFAHPLLASICYEQAPVWKRRAVHRVLAGVVADVEEQARHLALAADGPDAVAASRLEAAAAHAAARGAPSAAGELLELAADLTPDDPALARRRRLKAATLHRLGDGERAAALLERLREDAPPGAERADVLLALADVLASVRQSDRATIIALCDEAIAEAGEDDARVARILAHRSFVRVFAGDLDAARADGQAAMAAAERVGDPAMLAIAIGRLGAAETYAVDITPGLLERGAELEQQLGLVLEYAESPGVALGRRLMRLDQIEPARVRFARIQADAAARGSEATNAGSLWILCMLDWFAGNWPRALEYALAAGELTELVGASTLYGQSGRVGALVEGDLGRVESARALAKRAIRISQASSADLFTIASIGTLGRLELALGDLEEAGTILRELPARLLAGGYNDPVNPVWADSIETLVALGELDLAGSYLEPFDAHAQRMGSGWAIAGAARCRGLVAAGAGDLVGAFAAFERSCAQLERIPYPFERARTLLCLGSAYRQAKQKGAARDSLEGAVAIFDELGAPFWGDKARAELRRISGRRRATDELTESEHRVALLAAAGRSNKDIAAELFMSVHTVGAHLSRAYRKLGIGSRAELADQLAKRASELPKVASEGAKL